ncbi:MAG: signal peptide peptidase SppA [Phycisphaera sp.]|nr:signal peptide peptidase SppA [Phycisphaera sp.]
MRKTSDIINHQSSIINGFLLSFFLAFAAACSPITFTIGGDPLHNVLEKKVVSHDTGWTSDEVAIIDVSGMIYNSSESGLLGSGENPVGTLHEKLELAAKDVHIKSVILRLNTPGGTVTASDAMYREVMRFKQQTHKPVVALCMDVTASGGYYLACAADRIVAYPTSVTGSIGVIVQTVSIKPALERWGVKAEAIVSGPNKETGSPLTVMTESQRQVLQSIVDNFYGRFKAIVTENRPNLATDKLAYITDGRVFTGDEALSLGIVDQLGDVYDAWTTAKKLAGIDHANLTLYHRPTKFVNSPYAASPMQPDHGAQVRVDLDLPTPGATFYYLWQPGQP